MSLTAIIIQTIFAILLLKFLCGKQNPIKLLVMVIGLAVAFHGVEVYGVAVDDELIFFLFVIKLLIYRAYNYRYVNYENLNYINNQSNVFYVRRLYIVFIGYLFVHSICGIIIGGDIFVVRYTFMFGSIVVFFIMINSKMYFDNFYVKNHKLKII